MHEHLSRDLFRAIHKGWRNPGDLAAIAMAHLFELCPHCRNEFETWRAELGEGVARDEGDYDGELQRIRGRTAANDLGPEGEQARIEGERREARSRAEELLALPAEDRLDWIRKERGRHSGLLLAEALIEECRRKTPGRPREGYVLADLARVTLHHAPVTAYAVELYGLALARLANAVRVIGDLPRADQVLGDARYILRSQADGDRLTRAETDSLEGSLRVSQYRCAEATAVLLRALMAYRLEKQPERVVAVLLQLARATARSRDFARVMELLDEAERVMPYPRNRFLSKIVHHLRARAWCAKGEYDSAHGEFERLEDIEHDDPLLRLRDRWLRSEIFVKSGNYYAGEEELRSVRSAFMNYGLRYDVASADLDLARIALVAGNREQCLSTLVQAEEVFVELGVIAGMSVIKDLRARARSS